MCRRNAAKTWRYVASQLADSAARAIDTAHVAPRSSAAPARSARLRAAGSSCSATAGACAPAAIGYDAAVNDQEFRAIQRKMATEWLRLADAVRRPSKHQQMQMQ